MKKRYSVGIIMFIVFNSTIALADYCNSRMGNLNFYAAGIGTNKSVTCVYRYCYYGCIYDSYTISGHFKPGNGPWEKDEDNLDVCHSYYSSNCNFSYDFDSNKYH